MNITEFIEFGKIENFNSNDIILKEGEKGNTVFMILRGIVGVFLKNGEELYKINELSEYEYFGEMAVADRRRRSATIIALEDNTITLEMDKDNFNRLISKKLTIGYKIIESLVKRIKEGITKIPELKEEIEKEYSLDFYYKLTENYTEISFLPIIEFSEEKIIEVVRELSGITRVINKELMKKEHK